MERRRSAGSRGRNPPGAGPSPRATEGGTGGPADVERLRTTLEHTTALVGYFDADGTCLFLTRPTARGSHGESERLVGRPPDAADLPPEARAWIDAVSAQLHAAGATGRRMFALPTPAGERYFELDAVPVEAAGGGNSAFVVTAWDITERVVAERTAERLEAEYAILNRIDQAIIHASDQDRMLAEACSIAVEMGGFRFAWIAAADAELGEAAIIAHAGARGFDLSNTRIPLRDEAGRPAGLAGRAIHGQHTVVVDDVQRDEAMRQWHDALVRQDLHGAAAFPLRLPGDRHGALSLYSGEAGTFDEVAIRLFGQLVDDLAFALDALDSRKRRAAAEAQLRESEGRYRDLFEKNPQPMWIFDVATLRILAVNDAALDAYGFSRDEFLAMTIRDIRPQEDIPRLMEDVRRPGIGLRPIGHWRHVRRDGSILHVEITAHDIDWLGAEARLVLVTDITARRELEARLAQAARMEAIGHLAGGIAHDFNNLLTAVNGYADLLLTEIGDREQREELMQIRRAGTRAADLTRQILAFARRQVLQPQPVDLNDIVTGVVPLIRRLIGEQIRLDTSFAPTPAVVNADRGQIEQVLLNLAVNAADAMPQGGRLAVETQLLETAAPLGRTLTGTAALLTVTDTGVGMDAATLEHIFEPFFTTKPAGQGTGLGLATVHGIVSQSGGDVWATSEPGRGSTFSILLPALEALPEATSVPASPRQHAPGEATVLVVEDEQVVRALAVATLERAGYHVLVAQSPAQAAVLSAGLDEPIDLLLTDLIMPGGNGRDLARQLRAARPEMRVLVMSGYDDTGTEPVPGETYLAKPFGPDELLSTIERVLRPEG